METMVVETEGEATVEDSFNEIDLPTGQVDADPVVYKLVRVDGNGRLVPATDEEFRAVEDLLVEDKSENLMMDTAQSVECSGMWNTHSSEDTVSGNLGDMAGTLTSHGTEAAPKNLNVPCEDMAGTLLSPGTEARSNNMNVPCEQAMDTEKQVLQLEENVLPLASASGNRSDTESRSAEGFSNPLGGIIEKRSQISSTSSSWKPDFSKLEGELHLDNLTVRELQETFKATFGRETSVKDKQWLKRRIIMGLTHSCDFSTTTLVIKNGTVVKKGKQKTCKSMEDQVCEDREGGIISINCEGFLVPDDNKLEVHSSDTKGIDSSTEYNGASEDNNEEKRATKRVRKPTKRYIEELSEVEPWECSGKSVASHKYPVHGHQHQEVGLGSVPTVQFSRPLVTRQDSLGGSGVLVPYVSRIRRSRPRKDVMALVTLQHNGIGMTTARMMENGLVQNSSQLDNEEHAGLVEEGLIIHSPQLDKVELATLVEKSYTIRSPKLNSKDHESFKSQLSFGPVQVPVKHNLNMRYMELIPGAELQNMETFADSSDDNVAITNIPQGAMRRKHHRPWALNEVVKLVEGVAKYGVGRWSEIKRVAFASSPYRTSVDLKDKWRNLLRASFAQLSAGNEMQKSRKHSSIPIPAPILKRVRDLAEMQEEVSPINGSSKFAAHSNEFLTV
ncbi:hypothetical protein LIER_00725 [Lithospermum erythrorhizon]|uniref:Uncharacterized protein n=1 Tax=Lithospermum erythrorhizon TaxID=34254 RepID=A0AAV3NJ54_LITER